MMILAYQLVIFLIIVLSRANHFVIGCCIAWTVFHIIVPWLMLLQLFTIFIGWIVGSAIRGLTNKDD